MTTSNKIKVLFLMIFSVSCLFCKGVFAQDGVSLFLSPETGSFKIGDDFSVDLNLNSENTSINAAETTIYFPADTVEVSGIERGGSIFSIWPQEPSFSNDEGKITFTGGIPNPGFLGKGKIFTILFKAKNAGDIILDFGTTRVLANDGLGTNLLCFIKGQKYYIFSAEKMQVIQPLQIFSLTHPNDADWVSNNKPEFQWVIGQDITNVSFILDKNENTLPDNVSEGRIQEKKYDMIPDGIWYFHIKFENDKGWSDARHYKIMVDTLPPKTFEIIIDNGGDPTKPDPNLYFETEDDVSGIKEYKIRIGDGGFSELLLAQINPFALPKLEPGTYRITVRAQDLANNIVTTRTSLSIDPIETPKISVFPERYVSGEEIFYLEGTSVPDAKISIFLTDDKGKEVKKWEAYSNLTSQWSFSTKELLKQGIYYLSVMAEDQRGAKSQVSGTARIEVSLSGLALGNLIFTFRQIILFLFIILICGVLVFCYFVFSNSRVKKILKRETKEAKDSLVQSFSCLEKEIEKKIELFDLTPGMNEQERRVFEDIKTSFSSTRDSIKKEIQDIEKELG